MYRIALALIAVVFTGALSAQNFSISSTPVAGLPDVDGKIWDVLEHNGKLYIAGEFTTVGTTPRNRLAEIDLSTNQVTSWNPNPDLFCTSLAVHNNILYVGGGFTLMGATARESLASFDLSSHTLTSWDPTCALPYGASNIFFDDDVHCLELVGDVLYAGGGFTAIDGTPRGHVCSFDLNNLGNANGLTNWDPNVLASVGSGSPSYGVGGAQAMYIDAGSDLCVITGGMIGVGGDHWQDGSSSGHPIVSNFVVCVSASGTGAPSTDWVPDTVGYNAGHVINTCYGIGSTCYISGLIGSVTTGGVTETRNTAAALDMTADTINTNATTGWDIAADERVWAWSSDTTNSRLFIGGGFTTINGQACDRLCMVDPNTGALDTSWLPNPDGFVRAIDFAGSRVYIAGEFTQIGGQAHMRLAAFDIGYPTNAAPTLTVTSGGNPITDGATLNVAHNSTLNGLALQIDVADADGDTVALAGSVSNVGTTGILASEFNHSASAPYVVYPATGVFDAPNTTHTVTLNIDDGKGGTASLTFDIQVAGTGMGSGSGDSGSGGGSGGGGCTTGSESGIWLLAALMGFMGLVWLRRRTA
ncbi:MAG: hypothetical protein KDB82_01105 [Planctomycetes bacterium]|nr:hypothetical protein [Planctomycetota bacterium]